MIHRVPAGGITGGMSLGGMVLWAALVSAIGCGRSAPSQPEPEFTIVPLDARLRVEDKLPPQSPIFDGNAVTLDAARGEVVGFVVWYREQRGVRVEGVGAGLTATLSQLQSVSVTRRSTVMFGKSRGRGSYPDVVAPLPDGPVNAPVLVELAVSPDAAAGPIAFDLHVGEQQLAVSVVVHVATVSLTASAWGYFDRRELRQQGIDENSEQVCVEMFLRHGVVATPEMTLEGWAKGDGKVLRDSRFPFIPVLLPKEEPARSSAVAGWIAATQGSGAVPFSIPIDEPRGKAAWASVREFATAVRAAGGGPGKFLYAVTDVPRREYADLVDLYIIPSVHRLRGDGTPDTANAGPQEPWTYNGTPPRAGNMVVDAGGPDLRTWGWIGWRYQVPVWYVWDVLYWHDRHNLRRRGQPPLLGPPAPRAGDAVSFDDGEDHGNLDGVLAAPPQTPSQGCAPTLRLKVLRQGLYERALLDQAATCAGRAAADAVAATVVPRALGDVGRKGTPTWPKTAVKWADGRAALFRLLAGCGAM